MSVAAPLISKDLGLDPADLGFVFSSFFFSGWGYHGLTKETVELTRLVGRLQFGQERTGDHHVASAPSRPVERVCSLNALKATGRGGAAPKPSVAAATESWEEF